MVAAGHYIEKTNPRTDCVSNTVDANIYRTISGVIAIVSLGSSILRCAFWFGGKVMGFIARVFESKDSLDRSALFI